MAILRIGLTALGSAGLLIGAGRYLASKRRQTRAQYPLPASLVIEPAETVTVMRCADGSYQICWHEMAHKAQVYAGAAPDQIDYSQPVATAEHAREVVVRGLNALPRPYFELHRDDVPPVIVVERVLALEGVSNFRDIGGYLTQDGRRVRWGQVYRAGSFAGVTPADEACLQHLGLRLICDLRSLKETRAHPNRLPRNPAPAYLHLPIEITRQSRERMRSIMFNPRDLQTVMEDSYVRYMIEANAATLGRILRLIADPANRPIAIHCTAGKDRTGVTMALLLAALGVPDEVIIADYSLSNHAYSAIRDFMAVKVQKPHAFLLGLHIDDFQPLLTAHPQTMQHTLDYIRREYGTAEQYLVEKAGLDRQVIETLRADLLD